MVNVGEIDIQVRPIDNQLLDEAKVLYAGQEYKARIWQWQFAQRFGRTPLAIIARNRGQLIGFNATMPVQLRCNGKVSDAWWSCDFVVDEHFRGHGIGSGIKDKMLETIPEPIMSLGISGSALPILIKKGWQKGPVLHVYERVLVPQKSKDWLLKLWGDSVCKIATLQSTFQKKRYFQIEERNTLPEPEELDALWARYAPLNCTSINKNYEYLHWRYERFPGPGYRYFQVFRKGRLEALAIARNTANQSVEVTDYIGPVAECEPFLGLTRIFEADERPKAKSIVWRTHNYGIAKCLIYCGYIRKRYATQFVYRTPKENNESSSWELSAGDSDGDFLGLARELFSNVEPVLTQRRAPSAPAMPSQKFRLERISEQRFAESKSEWNTLLDQSDANPLFMSWEWQFSWWQTWHKQLGLELYCHYLYQEDRLVGILPLFRYRTRRWGFAQIHFIGNAWRVAPTVRSEYISPVLMKEYEEALYHRFDEWINGHSSWTYFVLQDYVGTQGRSGKKSIVRQKDVGYVVSTCGNLNDYVLGLGRQTRLKAFNRQTYLAEQYGDAVWRHFSTDPISLEKFFSELNRFHEQRWGKPCFDGAAVEFHKTLILSSSKIKPWLHSLSIDGMLVSLSYNLEIDSVLYNIQSGYEENFDKKLSLGTLHIGKLIQECFESTSVYSLDLLAGRGKHTDYKNHFKGKRVEFRTVQKFSAKWIFEVYKIARKIKSVENFLLRNEQ